MSGSIVELVDNLPTDNLTVKVLKALDFIVPGQWENLVGFDNTISAITGETDSATIENIRERAIALYDDKSQGYQTAIWLYRTLDGADKAVAAAALADKIGDTFSFIPFLDKLTPKADSLQSVDLKIKLVGELIAYSKLNGLTLNPSELVSSLKENYQNEALMRMAGLIALDGVLPLGADFVSKIREELADEDVTGSPAFGAVSQFLPDTDATSFINESFDAIGDWMANLAQSVGLNPSSLSQNLGVFIEIADDKLDYLAAFLDSSTNYFEHTGIQTVARRLITQAHSDL
ncbi:MAG: hypothetical protein F6J86_20235 [Symploca sp. SIO1B1]|nr:hypothetical protein [Symploca sp. SIO1C2]NER96140.1 hypothetical protein [Symploca sp. SIO1B1]